MRCCAAEMAPHRNSPRPPQIQQPKTAGANSKLDKTWGQRHSYIWTAEGWLYLAVVLDVRRANDSLDHLLLLLTLPDPGFILEPDFDHLALGGTGGDFCHSGGEVFLNAAAASASCA